MRVVGGVCADAELVPAAPTAAAGEETAEEEEEADAAVLAGRYKCSGCVCGDASTTSQVT